MEAHLTEIAQGYPGITSHQAAENCRELRTGVPGHEPSSAAESPKKETGNKDRLCWS